jgi:hypothetical protein
MEEKEEFGPYRSKSETGKHPLLCITKMKNQN